MSLLSFLSSLHTAAAVTEPSGLVVPIPQSQSNDYYDRARYNESTLGIQSMLDVWEGTGNVDAYADASATSISFLPLCGFGAELVLRGSSCIVDFGWYCADDAPGAEAIHPIVTTADIIKYHDVTLLTLAGKPPAPLTSWLQLQNNDKMLLPTVQSGFLSPAVGSGGWQNILQSPEYKACVSGKIGFAFKGNKTSVCPMSKFVDPQHNQMSTYGAPWINAAVYASKSRRGSYYIAFEGMPTSASSFTPTLGEVKPSFPMMMSTSSGWETWKNDGDFNDSGLSSRGGPLRGRRTALYRQKRFRYGASGNVFLWHYGLLRGLWCTT
ncbi:MAG: hypothetical protein QM784_05675 [Polyangiaceae bacterium]